MSNSCKMPLKAYMQCLRSTEAFQANPTDQNMAECSKLPEVEEHCGKFRSTYQTCKADTMDMTNRFRGNRALRQG